MEEYMEEHIAQPIKVYIQVNGNNEITEINSEEFIPDTTGWICIDDGYGDKYRLAQSHYLQKPLYTEYGDCNYLYINGEIVEKDHTQAIERQRKLERIDELKILLKKSDYKFNKYGEGWMTEEEYAPIRAQRQAWRDEINSLEQDL